MSWIYKYKQLEQYPSNAMGFVYLIIFPDGKSYVGKKSLFSKRKRNFGKKEIALLTDKRLKKYEYVTKDSDWRDYNSSNKDVINRIKNGDEHTKLILEFAVNKKNLTYLEEMFMYKLDVLTSGNFYNDNIAGRFFTKDTDEWAQIRK